MLMKMRLNSSDLKTGDRIRKDRLHHSVQNGHRKKPYWDQNFHAFVFILPSLAAVLCYLNGIDGTFVHDDVYAIRDNADVIGKVPLSRLFFNDFWGKAMCDNTSHKSYRPLTVLTFRLDYYVGGGSPLQFHVVNLILHAVVTWLFLHVLRHVVHVQDLVAGAAALFFAVHPVHTEAVTGIVGRAELLSCLGVLLSVICYARSLGISADGGLPVRRSVGRTSEAVYLWLALGISGAAMLCKEHGIMGLGICGVLDVFVFSRAATRRWLRTKRMDSDVGSLLRRLAAIACVGGLFMWFRLRIMCGQMPAFKEEDNPASFSSFTLTRVLTFNYLVAFNVWLLLCPRVLSYDWQMGSIPLVTGLQDARNLQTLAVYLVLALAAVTCLRDLVRKEEPEQRDDDDNGNNDDDNNNTNKHRARHENGQHVLLVSLILMALPFLPSSNLLFRVGFVVAERVLYIPSLGYCLLVAHGAAVLWEKYKHAKHSQVRWCLILSATAVLLLMAGKTCTRNRVWHSRQTLFLSGIQTLPQNAKMHYNYANFLKDSGHRQQAALHYKTAISLYPRQPSYHNNLGTVLEDNKQAESCYREALRLHPSHRGALVNLGNLLINSNNSSGEQLLHKALSIDPNYIDALLSLSQLELRRKRWDKAEVLIKKALKLRPDLPDLYNYYGIIFHHTGQYEQAVASYSRAVSLDSKFSHALTNAAASLKQLGRHIEAEQFLKRAVAATQDLEAMGQLGLLYQNSGRAQDAMEIYSQMAHRAPNDTDVLLKFVKTLMDAGQFQRAKDVLNQIINSVPHNPDVLFAMGHAQERLGYKQEAIKAFEEALRWAKDKSHLKAMIHYELGNVHKDLKQYPMALESYQLSVQVDPSLTHAHHNLGALYHLMGQYELARQHYEYVLQEEPDNQLLLQNMAKLERASQKQQQQQQQQHPSG